MPSPSPLNWRLPGSLIAFPVRGRSLDGFWAHGAARRDALFVLVHGMGGNFYHSVLKKMLMARGMASGYDVLSFNNRGSGEGVRTERFADCLADLDAALAFGRRQGYRRFVLAGHSTGCQKIAYHQLRRADPAVEALVHLAPGDDHGILRRDLGEAGLARLTAWARSRIKAGHGEDPVPAGGGLPDYCAGFSIRRFLSIAYAAAPEARLFHYEGDLKMFSKLTLPMLVLFGTREEFACMPLAGMEARLRAATDSNRFAFKAVRGADHGFHGHERETADAVFAFLAKGRPDRGGRC